MDATQPSFEQLAQEQRSAAQSTRELAKHLDGIAGLLVTRFASESCSAASRLGLCVDLVEVREASREIRGAAEELAAASARLAHMLIQHESDQSDRGDEHPDDPYEADGE